MRPSKYGVFSLGCGGWLAAAAQRLVNQRTLSSDSPGLGHSLSYGDIWAGSVKGLWGSHPAIAAFCLSTMVFGMRVIREDAPSTVPRLLGKIIERREHKRWVRWCWSRGMCGIVWATQPPPSPPSPNCLPACSRAQINSLPWARSFRFPMGSSLSTINLPATGRGRAGWTEWRVGGILHVQRHQKLTAKAKRVCFLPFLTDECSGMPAGPTAARPGPWVHFAAHARVSDRSTQHPLTAPCEESADR